MGEEKALLAVGGVPLWKRQYDLLGLLGASERWVSMRSEQSWLPMGIGRINDPVEDRGPMGGVSAALSKTRYDHLAVLAVDLPAIDAAWFRRLGTRCADGIGAVGQHADGRFEPLAAIYPRRVAARLAGWCAEGRLSLQAFLQDAVEDGAMRVVEIPAEEAGWWVNWNTPGDLRSGA